MTFRVDHVNFCETVFELHKLLVGMAELAVKVVHSLTCIVGNVR